MAPGGRQPAKYKKFEVHEPKERLIQAPNFADKAVQRIITKEAIPMSKKGKAPVCSLCPYMKLGGRAICNGNNNGRPRADCFCTHPDARETFYRMFPRSPKMATFIGYTAMGGNVPQLKTSPKWCPLKEEI